MFLENIREAWQKRARRHQIQKAGEDDWKIFARALCNSSNCCAGYPIDCPCCFDNYFKATNTLERLRKVNNNFLQEQ